MAMNDFGVQKAGLGFAGWCLVVATLALLTTLFFQFYTMKALFFSLGFMGI